MAAKKKFYAVKVGKHPGIYTSWDKAKAEVTGVSAAQYKGFTTYDEAVEFMGDRKNNRSENNRSRPEIIVFTDGGSRNHGNVAGGHVKGSDKAAWAYLIDDSAGQHSDSAGEFGATNNRMEIMALMEALRWLYDNHLNEKEIGVVSDSRYVLNSIQKGWIAGWKKRGWKKSSGELKNKELWQQLDSLLANFPNIRFAWTKGHANNRGNVFVDELLNETMNRMK